MAIEPSDVIHAFLEELTHTHMNIYILVELRCKAEVKKENINSLNHVMKVIYLRNEMINS